MVVARSSSGGVAMLCTSGLWMTSRLAVMGRMAMHGRLNLYPTTISGVAIPGQSLMSMNALLQLKLDELACRCELDLLLNA